MKLTIPPKVANQDTLYAAEINQIVNAINEIDEAVQNIEPTPTDGLAFSPETFEI